MQYPVIVIDPPWPYERTAGQGVANKQYSLMAWPDIHALGPLLHAVAAPDCAIFLWTCAPLLFETIETVKAWGFSYKTKAFCWVKTSKNGAIFFGIGSYTASNTEDVWLLSNGTPKRRVADVSQVVPTMEQAAVVAPMGRHSAKPDAVFQRIERLFEGPYLEVFARRQRAGWACLGNEVDGLDIRESLAQLAANQPLPSIAREEPPSFFDLLEAA